MQDLESTLFDSIKESSKKADNFFFLTILVCFINVIAFWNKDFQFVSDFPKINIEDSWTFFLLSSVIILSFFGITGLHLINYLVKRFSFEQIIESQDEELKSKKRSLLTQNIYEFVFDYYLGRYFKGSFFSDFSRQISILSIIVLLIAINFLAVLNSIFFVLENIKISNSHFYLSLILPVLVVLTSFFLWKSFFDTIKRRKVLVAGE